jgi:hypothetical protein
MRLAWPSILLGLSVLACHTITEELPQDATPVNPANNPIVPPPAPVVVIPVPTVPAPTAPAPTGPTAPTAPPNPANPAPAPPPTSGGSCALPPGQFNENCTMQAQTFLGRVEAAIDEVIAQHPGYFNMSRTRGGCANCYQVVDPTGYVNAVARSITKNGVCGYYDGEELAVKNSNAFNDQYDILTSDLYIRRQGGAYRSTCRPAWF